ncbi:MAG: alcohol dehydrogenase catalytic domain-containing protein [bacterium]|nr:alcohol dehydrogenase catalytic domain-containing protein [bacterium]
MKSVEIKDVRKLEVVERDDINSHGNDVVVKVLNAGICGSDIHNYDAGAPVGLVMGHEFCGEVINPGDRTDLKVGDRVTALPISPCGNCEACKSGNPQYCSTTWNNAIGLSLTNPGAFSEKTFARSDMVIKVPDSVSSMEAAMVEPTAVSLHGVNLANIEKGDKVLVIGAGIIGMGSAMLAKLFGASYVAVSETNLKRGEKAVSLGVADKYYNALDPEFLNQVMTETQGGFDKVIECCGNGPAVSSAIMSVKPGGTVVLLGVSTQPITTPLVMGVMKELTLKGGIAYTKEEFVDTLKLIEDKKIDVLKFVDDVVSLDEVQKSFERLTSGNDDAIKILIDPTK